MVMEPVEDGPRRMVWGDRSVSLGQPWGAEEERRLRGAPGWKAQGIRRRSVVTKSRGVCPPKESAAANETKEGGGEVAHGTLGRAGAARLLQPGGSTRRGEVMETGGERGWRWRLF